ncbi:hypothetical protein [Sphingomonas sp.]|uniref:hypothetical protein n=1 Tax=Sphingomonas sp. TaxID=28214 RepID=UPI0028A7B29E|nr:hypothetical protein [Sphingomonas sp.]
MTDRRISWSDGEISQSVNAAQMRMFDLAYRKHGFSRKILHLETGIPLSTLKSWEEGTSMPIEGAVLIAGAKGFPNELLSLLFEPAAKTVCDAEPDEADIDDLAISALDVLQKYVRYRHPESAGGVRLVPGEIEDIRHSAAGFCDRASKVA